MTSVIIQFMTCFMLGPVTVKDQCAANPLAETAENENS